jgi:hypothetical protein
MMGELKQIRISSLKSLIIASLLCFVKLWLVHPSEFKSLKGTKNEEHTMRLELERVWSYFFKTFEPNYHSSSSFVFCVVPLLLMPKKHL